MRYSGNYIKLLGTDFYQITMATAYLLLNQANKKAGFEAFVRNIKPAVSPIGSGFYVFHGSADVDTFMKAIREDLRYRLPEFIDAFIEIIEPKLPADRRVEYVATLRQKLLEADKNFEYSVATEHSIVFPFMPVVQFRGPIWIGQLIETPLLNIINGQTGVATRYSLAENFADLNEIMGIDILTKKDKIANAEYYSFYLALLQRRAIEYRQATDKVILEAAFRRAPGWALAVDATTIALNAGWNGTSNVAAYMANGFEDKFVGGTMAHSFIMSQKDELTAYKLWDSIFPNSTMLIDTYSVADAVGMLIANNIKPACVRIDSAPLDRYARLVRKTMDAAGWGDVQIFLSGDVTPELLKELHVANTPFDKVMAGTEYVNISDAKKLNAGYVYKLVEVDHDGETVIPLKKATGKKNYGGLKTIKVEGGNVIVSKGFGLADSSKILRTSTVSFDASLPVG